MTTPTKFVECVLCRSRPGRPVLCDECTRRVNCDRDWNAPRDERKNHCPLVFLGLLSAALLILSVIGIVTAIGWCS